MATDAYPVFGTFVPFKDRKCVHCGHDLSDHDHAPTECDECHYILVWGTEYDSWGFGHVMCKALPPNRKSD